MAKKPVKYRSMASASYSSIRICKYQISCSFRAVSRLGSLRRTADSFARLVNARAISRSAHPIIHPTLPIHPMRFLRQARGVAYTVSFALLVGCNGESIDSSVASSLAVADAASRAAIFTIPLYQFYAVRQRYIAQGIAPNTFLHSRQLADSSSTSVTKPNHDTLYSDAMLQLDRGPVRIDIPSSGTRYFSLALMDAYTNNFAIRGTSVDNGMAKTFWVVGPSWQGTVPADVTVLRSSTNAVWALARTYVGGASDYPAAWAVQNQLVASQSADVGVTSWDSVDKQIPPGYANWTSYFRYVNQLLKKNPPAPQDADVLANALDVIGVGPTQTFEPPSTDAASISTGAAQALASLTSSGGKQQVPDKSVAGNAWTVAPSAIGNYGTDYALRAHVALSGLGALPSSEATYYASTGPTNAAGVTYDGNSVYEIAFPAGQLPPARAFWSLTLYGGTNQAQAYFYPNPDQIYALSYPASNFQFADDGSLVLAVSHTRPAGVPTSNWLPAPAGAFNLTLRAYLPDLSILNGTYTLPPMIRVQ
ncbi:MULTISPECIES: DUF1254 domain-containing protein [Paraburkholderia]|uniref:DUF1254 domain-containing protein n=1 Tax=Paraburkholderia TaxID=1822464 RepID=UPI002250D4DE|nr:MULTISPECIES: DUF1254 domain-containing protein [Paraburkholderia]MCX4163625.1 DUF1254 domain-containing protein [Paraburkholderia megapolitana]MDN7159120.1 DUF1254 domain-containing protein [Paraburkholderia sp. CHISQ3]MDQ6496167.1 DUF1254 domain-containing protein [Paraburkholderia megapolitana]